MMSADDEEPRNTDEPVGEHDRDNHSDDADNADHTAEAADTHSDTTRSKTDTQAPDSTISDDSIINSTANPNETDTTADPQSAPDIETLQREIKTLRADLDAFEEEVESRTVDRPTLKTNLEQYIRKQLRRGKARGWGPYLVLLYGTATTIAAFYLLDDFFALIAMIIIYLSTLGLYVLFVLFGAGLNAVDSSRNLLDWIR
ncbi:hypothetical protein [Haloquadratum walsbyi]|jgi:membrane protein|uniref:Uncharacterized protein n=2 Tax=Haloquadratum walsbyi TaxID=293091 RepID=Q18EA1_HALWD|nr:hypothetical protein [Haloquadratum walsbyi]CAJ53732.1 uncharacterized protein HQ_3645A [Haloquadratum walsbyi DSM 16790]